MKEHQTGSLSNSKLMTILSPSLSSCQERSSHGGVLFFSQKGKQEEKHPSQALTGGTRVVSMQMLAEVELSTGAFCGGGLEMCRAGVRGGC